MLWIKWDDQTFGTYKFGKKASLFASSSIGHQRLSRKRKVWNRFPSSKSCRVGDNKYLGRSLKKLGCRFFALPIHKPWICERARNADWNRYWTELLGSRVRPFKQAKRGFTYDIELNCHVKAWQVMTPSLPGFFASSPPKGLIYPKNWCIVLIPQKWEVSNGI